MTITIVDLPVRNVVTCFLERQGRILLLKRSEKVGTYRGRWAGVSGFVEANPDAQSLIEILEETGLAASDIQLIRKGQPLELPDYETKFHWIVHPYLYRVKTVSTIQTDWEHCDTRWIKPVDIDSYNTVPGLKDALMRVYPLLPVDVILG